MSTQAKNANTTKKKQQRTQVENAEKQAPNSSNAGERQITKVVKKLS